MSSLPRIINEESTREGFARGVLAAAYEDQRVVVLGADVTGSLFLTPFRENHPDRFISVGIAEQNAASVAAGLALSGFRSLFATYATFATTRALDQIRVSICYNNAPVVIAGAHAGLSVGPDGATHQALEDIAVMRSLPNMTVVAPCDSNQAQAVTHYALRHHTHGPIYIRLGRAAMPNFTDPKAPFQLGKGTLFSYGDALTVATTGTTLWAALQAARQLAEEEGIGVRVLSLPTIKPLDEELLGSCFRETAGFITVEEHQLNGGLGGAIAEFIGQAGGRPLRMMGVKDQFGESGAPEELLAKYGLDAPSIAEAIRSFAHQLKA